ncbi:MAG: DNA gyrase C-terminal beta-propeller domain-containing protein, partial [Planctomycetota bacterium]
FSNLGSAYVMRIHDVPATSGYGEPIQKHFKFQDGERIVGAVSLDPRLVEQRRVEVDLGEVGVDGEAEASEGGLLLAFAATAQGNVLCFDLAAHTDPSKRGGRRYCRVGKKDDEVLKVEVVTPDLDYVVMATTRGRAIAYELGEVKILQGAGKGVRGVRLEKGDRVVAAGLSSGRGDAIQVETSKGNVHDLTPANTRLIARGGKGIEKLKRDRFRAEVPAKVLIPVLEQEESLESAEGKEEE